MAIIQNVMEMTWNELKELDKDKTVILVTVAPIEEHSRHLPMGTDIYEGEKWRNDAVALLSKMLPEINFLSLPPVPIATAGTEGFYGNLYFKQRTVRIVTCEMLESLVSWGVKNIIIIASHADPLHIIAIEEACCEINGKHGVCAFSPMGALFSAHELGIEIEEPEAVKNMSERYPNDFHAGWVETSNMLDIDSSIVRNVYTCLPDALIEAEEMTSPQKVLTVMGNNGHIGYPRLANKELGTLLNQKVAKFLSKAVVSFIERNDYEKYEHHFLYRIPFLRTDFHDASK